MPCQASASRTGVEASRKALRTFGAFSRVSPFRRALELASGAQQVEVRLALSALVFDRDRVGEPLGIGSDCRIEIQQTTCF